MLPLPNHSSIGHSSYPPWKEGPLIKADTATARERTGVPVGNLTMAWMPARASRSSCVPGQTPSRVPPTPEMPSLQGMHDRISELLLDNYVITGNADWIALRNQATTIFSVATSTTTRNAPVKTSPLPRALPPTEWDIDSTRILDVSMMLDGNYNATADPEWLEIGSRIRSCYRDFCPVDLFKFEINLNVHQKRTHTKQETPLPAPPTSPIVPT